MTRKNQRPNKAPCPRCGITHSWHHETPFCIKALKARVVELEKEKEVQDEEQMPEV